MDIQKKDYGYLHSICSEWWVLIDPVSNIFWSKISLVVGCTGGGGAVLLIKRKNVEKILFAVGVQLWSTQFIVLNFKMKIILIFH